MTRVRLRWLMVIRYFGLNRVLRRLIDVRLLNWESWEVTRGEVGKRLLMWLLVYRITVVGSMVVLSSRL